MARRPSSIQSSLGSHSDATTTDDSFCTDDEEDDVRNNRLVHTRLRIRLYASNLPRRGNFGNRFPDSFAIVTASKASSRSLHQGGVRLGTTEVVQNSRHPHWIETFTLDYTPGTELYFNVLVMEAAGSNSSSEYSKNDGSGSAVFEVADILATKHRTRARRLRRGGVVFCRLDPVQQSQTQQFAVFRLAGRDLIPPHRKFKMFSSAPDTIVKVARQDSTTHNWMTIYRSQPVNDSFNPAWDRIEIDLSTLCEGDLNRPIRFTVAMVRENRPPQSIGMIETTLNHLLAGDTTRTGTTLPDPDDESLASFTLQRNLEKIKPVGQMVVRRAYLYEILPDGTHRAIEGTTAETDNTAISHRRGLSTSITESTLDPRVNSINDMVAGNLKSVAAHGCELQVYIAIDFTSSNGDPRLESSLHFQSPALNVYEETITSIVAALEDEIKMPCNYTVWGFGAKFADGVVRHIFQCGLGICQGLTSILEAYKNVFSHGFTMSGPTCCAKVLQAAAVQAKRSQEFRQTNSFKYNILLVITDGNMSDIETIHRKLAVYQDLPLSVILVGVGRSDFSIMRRLAQHFPDKLVFVNFREVQSNPVELAEAALSDLPRQIHRYIERCL